MWAEGVLLDEVAFNDLLKGLFGAVHALLALIRPRRLKEDIGDGGWGSRTIPAEVQLWSERAGDHNEQSVRGVMRRNEKAGQAERKMSKSE